ncbi:unnamed protein product [Vicia faba]|uniref:SHSP domain-containing protein n=1 Tax=Vicia faba TaxID=3906 RepID=A0AAV0Z9L7_VICFA|nr:unnamed protein product [Vicia faba]
MKKRHHPSYSSSSSEDYTSSSSEEDISVMRIAKINKDMKKPKPQENGNPNGKNFVIEQKPPTRIATPSEMKKPKPQEKGNPNTIIEQQPPIMIRSDNVDMSAANPVDVKVYADSYVYEMDMPGMKSGGEIKVEVEEDDYLVISGERKREEGVEYLRAERKVGKFMRRFVLPKNANTDAVSAVCQDGVLSVTLQKLPPPKNPRKTIQVIIA